MEELLVTNPWIICLGYQTSEVQKRVDNLIGCMGGKVDKKRAYERYLEAASKRIKNEDIDVSVTGDIQLSMLEALRDHVTWCRNPSKSKPLPEEMAFELVIYFRDLVAGFKNI